MPIKTTFSLSIDVELKRRLQELSDKSKISMAKIIEELLEEKLPIYEKKYGINPKLNL
ncbi:MAG: ribbon-helix-helix domain-containing protein [bacterium]